MKIFRPIIKDLSGIAEIIKIGEVMAAPTETAYGLLADATNNSAVNKIFKIKLRSKDKVSALLVADLAMARRYGYFSKTALNLARRLWPGPITLVIRAKKSNLSPQVIKDGYVGMRVPKNVWLRRLLLVIDKPLTATSANIGGGTLCYSAKEVKKQLKGRLKFLVNGGKLPQRKVSTIVKVVNSRLVVLREGVISLNEEFNKE